MQNKNKVHDYKGYKIQNSLYGSEVRWFIYDKEMDKIKTHPKKTLKEAKEWIDEWLKNFI